MLEYSQVIIFWDVDEHELILLKTYPKLYLRKQSKKHGMMITNVIAEAFRGRECTYLLTYACFDTQVWDKNPMIMRLTKTLVPQYGPLIVEKFVHGNKADCTLDDTHYLQSSYYRASL
jgi:hypothetical protein